MREFLYMRFSDKILTFNMNYLFRNKPVICNLLFSSSIFIEKLFKCFHQIFSSSFFIKHFHRAFVLIIFIKHLHPAFSSSIRRGHFHSYKREALKWKERTFFFSNFNNFLRFIWKLPWGKHYLTSTSTL